MSKRILSLIMALAMALALVSCSSSKDTASESEDISLEYGDWSYDDTEVEADPLVCESADEVVSDITYETETKTYSTESEEVTHNVTYPTNLTYNGDCANLPDAVKSALEADVKYVSDEYSEFAKVSIEYVQEELESDEDMSLGMFDASYNYEIKLFVTRADSAILSAVVVVYDYIDGDIYDTVVNTFNYDAQTGDKLTFETLGSDFRAKAEELVATAAADKQADTDLLDEDYTNYLCYVVCDGTETNAELEEKAYPEWTEDESYVPTEGNADPTFYMTKDKIVFVAAQYMISLNIDGNVEFAIPYDDFGDAINSQYMPQ